MNRFLVAVLAGTFAAVAGAQTAQPPSPDKVKQQEVQSTTQGAVDASGTRATAKQDGKDTANSRLRGKPTKEQREADLKAMEGKVDANGGQATAKQDAKNTAKSKELSKQSVPMASPGMDKQMQKAATDK